MKCMHCNKNEARISFNNQFQLCYDCHNKLVAGEWGKENYKDFIRNIQIDDSSGLTHHFEIRCLILPTAIKWEATEEDGYSFNVYQPHNESPVVGLQALHEKIASALNFQSLKKLDDKIRYFNAIWIDDKQYNIGSIGTGEIIVDSDDEPSIVLDGHVISFSDFGLMATTYEGFTLEYQIRDSSEQLLTKNTILRQVDVSNEALTNRMNMTFKQLVKDKQVTEDALPFFIERIEEHIADLRLALNADKEKPLTQPAKNLVQLLTDVEVDRELKLKWIDQIDVLYLRES